jgi:hypothetical protein
MAQIISPLQSNLANPPGSFSTRPHLELPQEYIQQLHNTTPAVGAIAVVLVEFLSELRASSANSSCDLACTPHTQHLLQINNIRASSSASEPTVMYLVIPESNTGS